MKRIAPALSLAAAVFAGCAAQPETDSGAPDDVKYDWQQARNNGYPIRPECASKVRKTGSRIPRCPKESGISGKAYHTPGRTFDDRTGARQR